MFINFLLEKFPHLRFAYHTDKEMVEHFLSGEVNISVPDLLKYVEEWDEKKKVKDHTMYPSLFSLKQVVKIKLKDVHKDIKQLATVKGIHFYEGKVKYDLALWLGDGSVDNPEWESRIYNVDSLLLESA
jgi:hypothetical protein